MKSSKCVKVKTRELLSEICALSSEATDENKSKKIEHLWKNFCEMWNRKEELPEILRKSSSDVQELSTFHEGLKQHGHLRRSVEATPSDSYAYLFEGNDGNTILKEGCRFLSEHWTGDLNLDPRQLLSVKGLAGLDTRHMIDKFLRTLRDTVMKIFNWGSEEINSWEKSLDHTLEEGDPRMFAPALVGRVVSAIRAVIAIFAEDPTDPRNTDAKAGPGYWKERVVFQVSRTVFAELPF